MICIYARQSAQWSPQARHRRQFLHSGQTRRVFRSQPSVEHFNRGLASKWMSPRTCPSAKTTSAFRPAGLSGGCPPPPSATATPLTLGCLTLGCLAGAATSCPSALTTTRWTTRQTWICALPASYSAIRFLRSLHSRILSESLVCPSFTPRQMLRQMGHSRTGLVGVHPFPTQVFSGSIPKHPPQSICSQVSV